MFKRKPKAGQPEQPSMGPQLRAMVLDLSPSEIGLDRANSGLAWGVVMDTVSPDDRWHSLVVLADGTTSVYTSAAFGIIGAGEHANVRQASTRLLELVNQEIEQFQPTTTTELPGAGMVAIRALTFDGQCVLVAPEDDLGHGRVSASVIFHAAHDVIAEARKAIGK